MNKLSIAILMVSCSGSTPSSELARVPTSSEPTSIGPAPLTLSYAPTCKPGCPDASCLGGTEIQALESFEGRLYAGTTNWMETSACRWPRTSAQVMTLDAANGSWRSLPPLPDPQNACEPGIAPWEQVNDLQSVHYRGGSALLASTMPNEDGGCRGLAGTVFHLAPGPTWVDTGLGEKLKAYYRSQQSEIRYVSSHSDAECPADRPCIFAFVAPRGPRPTNVGPTVWRGRIDPDDPACKLVCWSSTPEAELDGTVLPRARRIVSAYSAGDHGLFLGTALGHSPRHDERIALLARDARGHWSTLWTGRGGESELRGIAGWKAPHGVFSLWFMSNPRGAVYRTELRNGRFTQPELEVRLVDVVDGRCSNFYGYQLYLHQQGDNEPVLAAASQSCGKQDDRHARIFYRHVESCTTWRSLELPEVRDDPRTARTNESAVRWLERSPFDPRDLFIGTTDMNNGPATMTARIYRLAQPFSESCS